LDYSKPEQLMYLTGQLSALGLGQGHSSPPEIDPTRSIEPVQWIIHGCDFGVESCEITAEGSPSAMEICRLIEKS
jgi:hypothetical protein